MLRAGLRSVVGWSMVTRWPYRYAKQRLKSTLDVHFSFGNMESVCLLRERHHYRKQQRSTWSHCKKHHCSKKNAPFPALTLATPLFLSFLLPIALIKDKNQDFKRGIPLQTLVLSMDGLGILNTRVRDCFLRA